MHWIILKYSLLTSALLFATGVVTIPWAAQFGPGWQDVIYFVGRVPIFYVVGRYIVYDLARKNEAGTHRPG